jgi:hypothetical protein
MERITLRWPAACVVCRRPIPAGERAGWSPRDRRTTCADCLRERIGAFAKLVKEKR